MIRDYSKYELQGRERVMFYGIGFLAFAGIIYLFYRNIIVALACGFFIVKAKPYYENYRAMERNKKLDLQFKDLLYSLSASISSGRQMSEALVEARENLSVMYSKEDLIMIELENMWFNIVENNESDQVLLTDFAERSKNENINNFVRVYVICRNLGGNLEKIITRTSDIITDKMNIQREIEVIMSQKKLEGRLIALMPIAMILILNVFSPTYIAPLYAGIAGRIVMTMCLGLLITGVWLMEKFSEIDI